MVTLGREEVLMMEQSHEQEIKEAHASLPGVEGMVCYRLTVADGASRITFDTGCRQIFNLTIEICVEEGVLERCKLTDIARDEVSALNIMAVMVTGQVTPCTAREVIEELLAEK